MMVLIHALTFARTAVVTVLAFALVFGLLAFAHEFGHFLMAKMVGMSVDQFGIGFPPNYGWTLFRRSGTSYTLHPVPLGAFVKIQGMDPGDQPSPNSFLKKPAWARLVVLFAGSAANMVLAVIVFDIVAIIWGLPLSYQTNVVGAVHSGSTAEKIGLKTGDKILGVRRVGTSDPWLRPRPQGDSADATNMVDYIHQSWTSKETAGKLSRSGIPLEVQLQHPGEAPRVVVGTPTLSPGEDGKPQTALGYIPVSGTEYHKMGPLEAGGAAFDEARKNALLIVFVLQERVRALWNHEISASEFGHQFSGPVAIARVSGEYAHEGPSQFLWFVGMISINIGILNLLPLPVFDGGNIVLVLIELVRRKQLEPQQFMVVQLAGVILILCLFAYITFNDIHPSLP